MSAAQEPSPAGAEPDRFEAQRQAFSRLMARFTADRDAMIAAVQQCNERIDSLAARLSGGEAPIPPADGGEAALGQRLEQQSLLAEARSVSDRALQRADEALRRWRELAELVNEKSSGTDSEQDSIGKAAERIGKLEELFAQHCAEPPPVTDDKLARETAERVSAIEELVRALDDSVDAIRHQLEQPPPPDLATPQIIDAGLRDLREQVSHLESMAVWSPKLQRLWVSLVASAVVAAFAVVYVR